MDHLEIWDDENGYASKIGEDKQARYNARMMILNTLCGIKKTIVFLMADYEAVNRWGLIASDWRKRPTYTAVQNVCKILDDNQRISDIKAVLSEKREGVYAHVFENTNTLLVLLWAGDKTLPASGQVDVVLKTSELAYPVMMDVVTGELDEVSYDFENGELRLKQVPYSGNPVAIRLIKKSAAK
ncbi:MAG: hypothetical protein JNM63_13345 [Spirochaetia bacterium]|nr:hypothetical protein [Spirochaetia bacterium]